MATGAERAAAAGGWADRVSFVDGEDPVAYRPGEVLVRLDDADPRATVERLARTLRRLDVEFGIEQLGGEEAPRAGHRLNRYVRVRFDGRRFRRPLTLVRELRAEGFRAQLNHVFFAHCESSGCGPHPAAVGAGGVAGSPVYASPVYASPVYASPVYASPVYASPVYASPVYASPVYASPVYASGAAKQTGRRRSSARAATLDQAADIADRLAGVPAAPLDDVVDVMILDVGLPTAAFDPDVLGAALPGSNADDVPDADADAQLDPAAGHGQYIAALVKSIAPSCQVAVCDVLSPLGDGDEVTIAQTIFDLPAPRARGSVLNLSFGGYVLEATLLADAIVDAQTRGWLVVASAGNDATCRPTYPAAFPDVIGVGAIGPGGPAPFTNYGCWVRACAPGVDLISSFFTNFTADVELGPLTGWATWSGTSFAAPVVAGTIMQEMITRRVHAGTAVDRVIDAPGLLRLHNLGTVVNRI